MHHLLPNLIFSNQQIEYVLEQCSPVGRLKQSFKHTINSTASAAQCWHHERQVQTPIAFSKGF